jgi:hypothetical protein
MAEASDDHAQYQMTLAWGMGSIKRLKLGVGFIW